MRVGGVLNKMNVSATNIQSVIPAKLVPAGHKRGAGIQSLLRPHHIIYVLLLIILTACGSNQHVSSDTGSVSFKLQLSRPTTSSRAAAATSADICTDYGITTISASVLNSSGATVASVSWSCSTHQGTVTDVPTGANYTVKLEGIDSNDTVAWTGEKTDISITGGSTTDAGTITMTYVGSDTTPPTVTSTNPSDGAANVPVTILITATFSEEMAISSINTVTFTVKNGATTVNGSVTYDSNTKKAIFIPPGNLSYSTTYTATITMDVEDMAGNNMQSDYLWDFTTEAAPTTAPAAPVNVTAIAGNNQVTITWDAIPGATSYNIYWLTTTGVTKTTGTQISGITYSSYTYTGLINGTTYYYLVTAVNSFGESNESSEVSATPQVPAPSAPTGVTATAGNGQTTISWSSVTGASYKVYWSTTSGTVTGGTAITVGNVTSYTHTAIANGTTYYYVVTAVNAGGESAASSQVSATPTPWIISTIDSMSAGLSIAVDHNNKVHISYYDNGTTLRYTTNISGNWLTYDLDTIAGGSSSSVGGAGTSVTTDSDNKVHISYYNFYNTYSSIKYATNASGSWATSTVDDNGTPGRVNAIVVDSTNKAHIAYRDAYFHDYKYATNFSSSWVTYILENDAGGTGDYADIDIARDVNNKLYISWWSSQEQSLKCSTNASGTWVSSVVDGSGDSIAYNSIAVDSNNNVHISYRDEYYGSLQYATNLSGSWASIAIDDVVGFYEGVGYSNSIAIDSNNKVHISYYDYWKVLKYATNVTGTWTTSVVDSSGNTGAGTSIAVDQNNNIHIAYFDETNGKLKYATKLAND